MEEILVTDTTVQEIIEPLIGQLKSDHLMGRSYYKGIEGDQINLLLSCSVWNLNKYMKKLVEAFLQAVFSSIGRITESLRRHFFALQALISNSLMARIKGNGDLEVSF